MPLPDVVEDSGQIGVVELLQVAQVVHLLGHPVGDHEDAAVSRLALVELRLDLAEERRVVVDVLDVLDVDAGAVGELGEGVVLARIDVARPVGDDQLALDLAAFGGLDVAGVAGPHDAAARAEPEGDGRGDGG